MLNSGQVLQMAAKIALLILACVLLPQIAEARIYRSCKGHYKVAVLSADQPAERSGFSIPASPPSTDCSAEYQSPTRLVAKGGCGDLAPDLCRNRARDQLALCMQVHWAANRGLVPSQCNGIPGYASKVGVLMRAIERLACCPYPKRTFAEVEVTGEIWGNSGCGNQSGNITSAICNRGPDWKILPLARGLKIDCAAVQPTCGLTDVGPDDGTFATKAVMGSGSR
jgi:hypothetical protein